jgi:hypothetical protein
MDHRFGSLAGLLIAVIALVAACGSNTPYLGSDSGADMDVDGDSDVDSDNDSDSDSDGDSDGDTDSACGEISVEFEMQTPTVVLLVDQSGSMTSSFGNGNRWNVLRNALLNEETGVVKRLEGSVRFGLQLYTSNGGSAGGQCPILTGVPAALDNHQAIRDVFYAASPANDTPTGESIAAVAAMLAADTWPDEKIILLATDGEPDTCEVPNPQTGQAESVAAAEAAFAAGFKTYIVSVGSEVSLGHMQDMANAGVGADSADPAPYYQALDPDALVAALEEIIYGVRDCVLELSGAVQDGMADQCEVLVDGEDVPFEDPDGWQLNDPSTIELLGETCEAIQEGNVSIEVTCPCDAVEIY